MTILAEGQVAATKETILLVDISPIFPDNKVECQNITFFNAGVSIQTVILFIKKKGSISREVHQFKLKQNETGEFLAGGHVLSLDDGDEIEASASSADNVNFLITGASIR